MTTADPHLPAPAHHAMLLDDLVHLFDATRIEHRVVEGTVPSVYTAVLEADFVRAWKDNAAVRALAAVRSTAEELFSRVQGRDFIAPPDIASMRLAEMPEHGEWVRLGVNAPHEIAYGVIGRFWSGRTTWRTIDASDFASFSEAGFAKIGCNFSLRPYGNGRTLVSYEARTKATDDDSRRQFLRYWKAVSPGAGIVMRSMLAVVEIQANR